MEFAGQNTGVGSLSLLQGIFPTRDWTQVSHMQADSLPAEPQGKIKAAPLSSIKETTGHQISLSERDILSYYWIQHWTITALNKKYWCFKIPRFLSHLLSFYLYGLWVAHSILKNYGNTFHIILEQNMNDAWPGTINSDSKQLFHLGAV